MIDRRHRVAHYALLNRGLSDVQEEEEQQFNDDFSVNSGLDLSAQSHRFESIGLQKSIRRNQEPENRRDDDDQEAPQCYAKGSIYPDWIRNHDDYSSVDAIIRDNVLNDALVEQPSQRTVDQLHIIEHYLSKALTQSTQSNGYFRTSKLDLKQIAKHAKHRLVLKDDVICKEGERGASFYIVFKGQLGVHKKQIPVAPLQNDDNDHLDAETTTVEDKLPEEQQLTLEDDDVESTLVNILSSGDTFGEKSLGQGAPARDATVVCISETAELLELQKADFDYIMKQFQVAEYRQAFKCVRNVPLFSHWSRTRLDQLVSRLQWQYFKKGATVVRQGDPCDNVYFVVDGRCDVSKDVYVRNENRWPTGPRSWQKKVYTEVISVKLMELDAGSYFGEKGILENSVRAATVKTLTDAAIAYLDKAAFIDLLRRGHAQGGGRFPSHVNVGYATEDEIISVLTHTQDAPEFTATGAAKKKKRKKKKEASLVGKGLLAEQNVARASAVGLLATGNLNLTSMSDDGSTSTETQKKHIDDDSSMPESSYDNSSFWTTDHESSSMPLWQHMTDSDDVDEWKAHLDTQLRKYYHRQTDVSLEKEEAERRRSSLLSYHRRALPDLISTPRTVVSTVLRRRRSSFSRSIPFTKQERIRPDTFLDAVLRPTSTH